MCFLSKKAGKYHLKNSLLTYCSFVEGDRRKEGNQDRVVQHKDKEMWNKIKSNQKDKGVKKNVREDKRKWMTQKAAENERAIKFVRHHQTTKRQGAEEDSGNHQQGWDISRARRRGRQDGRSTLRKS